MLTMTDADEMRFTPPESLVNVGSPDEKMRLDMSAFNMSDDHFGFSIGSNRNPNNTYVEVNVESTFLMMDKFMQLDFQLPT